MYNNPFKAGERMEGNQEQELTKINQKVELSHNSNN